MKKMIGTSGTKFIDQNNHQLLLHGVNMVCKDKAKNYIGEYTKEDFHLLRCCGFHVVRLGIFWDGVEPSPGIYDETYLDQIDQLIALAASENIVVYLDMHQDLFSCNYSDGAPDWATLTEGCEHVATELWSESYLLSPAVQHAFDQFWKNAPASDGVGIQEHFIRMWQHIAKRFHTNETVIGYDVFNEPFPGEAVNQTMEQLMTALMERLSTKTALTKDMLMGMWLDPEKKLWLLDQFSEKEAYQEIVHSIQEIPQAFDQTILSRFYQQIGTAIRREDAQALLFLEANYFSNAGVESMIVPVQDSSNNTESNQVFSPHGYDLLVDTQQYDQSSFDRLDVIFQTHKKVQERLNLPVLVGEWGCFPNAGEAVLEQAYHLMDLFASCQMSDTYFDFSHLNNNRILEAIVRPYPMKTSGELISWNYDHKAKNFSCCINESEDLSAHVIYVPDLDRIQEIQITPYGPGYQKKRINSDTDQTSAYSNAGYLIIDSNHTDGRMIHFHML